MKRIPIQAAKDVAKKYGVTRVVLVLQEPDGRQHVVSYGKGYDDCVKAAIIGNSIKLNIFGWPIGYCQDKPARQLRKEKQNKIETKAAGNENRAG
jgi:hypothetical protein